MKFAVIGAGVIGRLRAKSIHDNSRTEVAAVVDLDESAASASATAVGARAFTDYREALASTQPDAVVISSPVQLHEEMCLAAFEAGCEVLLEKPISNSAASGRRIFDAAQQSGRRLAVGFNHRFYPSFAYLADRVRDGSIGELDHLRVIGGHDGLANFRADWQYKGEISGGGAMYDVGIHMTDIAQYVAGDITEVYGVASNRVWKVPKSEDNAVAVFRSESGVPIHYQATWNEWKGYRSCVEAYGTTGMVRAWYAPMFNMLITSPEPGGPRKKKYEFYLDYIFREKFRGWETTTELSFREELSEFLNFVEGKASKIADGWAGFRAIEIAEAVYRSSEEGTAVTLAKRPE